MKDTRRERKGGGRLVGVFSVFFLEVERGSLESSQAAVSTAEPWLGCVCRVS